MIKAFVIIFTLILMLTGCQGCFLPGVGKQKTDLSFIEQASPEPIKTAVVVPLWGPVSENWIVDVEKALKNPKNDLIILKIESPGGSVGETLALLRKIQKYQQKYGNKQICIYSKWLLASGAYWVAAAFGPIIVSPLNYSGSIGVYIKRLDYSGFLDKLGVKFKFITSDSAKVAGHPSVPISEQEQAKLQQSVDNIYLKFLRHVWYYRSSQLLSAYANYPYGSLLDTVAAVNQFQQVANGSIYNARDARIYGLVDGVLFFDEFIKQLHMDGYATVLLNGKVIVDFYPMTEKDWKNKAKVKEYIKHRFQLEHK